VLAQGADIVPLIGARRRDRLQEAIGALALRCTDGDLAEIAQLVPKGAAQGGRYAPEQLAHLDSER
jgi:aryl-alcohol dehydrogenase-like predicted oxidoreductase